MNCRVENLSVPERTPLGRISQRRRPKDFGADFPWSKVDDRKLREAGTLHEAFRTSRHAKRHVLKRLDELGLALTPRKMVRPLAERDLALIETAADLLKRKGVTDHEINLAINISDQDRRQHRPTLAALERCVVVLFEAGWKRRRIGEALGKDQRTVSGYLMSAGLVQAWGAPSKAGLPERIRGEIWKDIGGGYEVSNLGRVKGLKGGLLSQSGGVPKVTLCGPYGHQTKSVAQLVLQAFRPDLANSGRYAVYQNGDRTDARLANLIPPRTEAEQQAIWRDARNAVPRWVQDTAIREDLAADAALIFIEGLAPTMAKAIGMAVNRADELSGGDLKGQFAGRRSLSIDEEVHGADGITIGDTISADADHF